MWDIYTYLWFFLIYAFLGWCTEVVYAAARHGTFVNRGFLNGPVCPIYGFGVCLVVAVLYPERGSLGLLFLGSVLLTSAIELVTGFLMEKLFHNRWWDYSNRPLNIGGYVCPLFSLLWGLACVLVVDVVHPPVVRLVALLPRTLGTVLLGLFGALLLTDLAITVACVLKLNRHLQSLDEAAERMRAVSNNLGEELASGTLAVQKRGAAIHAALEAQKREPGPVERRLLRAFPDLRSNRHADVLAVLKHRLLGEKAEPASQPTNPPQDGQAGTN